jgi:hypothetical protein
MRGELSERANRNVRRSARSFLPWLSSGLLAISIAVAAGCAGDPLDQGDCATCNPDGESGAEATLETSRFPRLSHLQWENTVRDLFYLQEAPGLSASFTGDPLGGVFDNNESSLIVTPGLWTDYRLAAEDLAGVVTSDTVKLAKLLPKDAPSDPDARAKAFIDGFGQRAYRRPLTADEANTYFTLFKKAPLLVEGKDDFSKGARLVIQAFLQSPHFVYRLESSSKVENGVIALRSYEIATKLSYMLWNTMPDDALFSAAAQGKLDTPEGVLAEAQRLLEDDRAKAMVASFHAQLFQYGHYDDLNKDPALFPNFKPALGADMKREAELFIKEVVFNQEGGIREILTEPMTFVNAELAPIYGLEGKFTNDFVKVDLDPAQRSGFLTRIGFLASNATKREQHSIHRGVFINRRILCVQLPNPPDNIPPLPPIGATQTNRERVEAHTGIGTCGEVCHGGRINPVGFAFEHYDALGQHKTEENGHSINSADTYMLDDELVSYNDAISFDNLIAESDMAQNCYAQHWIEYAFGRTMQGADQAWLPDLAAQSRKGAKALILALTQTKAFRTRTPVKETP